MKIEPKFVNDTNRNDNRNSPIKSNPWSSRKSSDFIENIDIDCFNDILLSKKIKNKKDTFKTDLTEFYEIGYILTYPIIM